MRISAFLVLLMLVFPGWASVPSLQEPTASQIAAEIPLPEFIVLDAHTKAEIDEMSYDVSAFYGGKPLRQIISEQGYLVLGTDLSIPEREGLVMFTGEHPVFSGFRKISDENAFPLLESSNFLVVLGGPSQNSVAYFLEKEGLVQKEWAISDRVVVRSGPTPGGGKFFIFSDQRGYNNPRKEGIEISPLRAFMPKEYIPVASFLISVLALAAIPVIRIYLAGIFKAKERDSGRRGVKETFTGISLFGFPIRFREILAVFLGAFFYGMGVAYLYAGPTRELLPMGIASVLFVALLYYFRSFVRWIFDGIYRSHTEYVFWGTGGTLCWISSVLGFTLQTPGFEVEKIPKELEKKTAFMKWAVLSAAMLAALTIFAINFLFPSPFLPVFQTVASAIAVTEILPIKPMPGALIKKWSFWLWALTFCTFIPIYFLINFYI